MTPEYSMTDEKIKTKTQKRTVRKRVVVEQEIDDAPDPKDYELVEFTFWNEEQKGIQVPYEWIDRWTRPGACKGTFFDGGTYKLPRIAYEYYKSRCSMPKYRNEQVEIGPGLSSMQSRECGRIYRFRLEPVR